MSLVIVSLLLFGCEASHDYIDGSSVGGYVYNDNIDQSLLEDAQNLINSNCTTCHGPGSPNGHLDFVELINDGYITAGPPEVSVFYRCLNKDVCITRAGGQSTNMAENGGLNQSEVDLLNLFVDELFIDPQ